MATRKLKPKPVNTTKLKLVPSAAESPASAELRASMEREDKIDRKAKNLQIDRQKAANSLSTAGMALVAIHEMAVQMGSAACSLSDSSIAVCLEAITERALREVDSGLDALDQSVRAGFFDEATGTDGEMYDHG